MNSQAQLASRSRAGRRVRRYKTPVRPPAEAAMEQRRALSGGANPNGLRETWQPLFDKQVIPVVAAGLAEQLFFNLGHTGGRTWSDTNVKTANRLPGEFMHSVCGISVNSALGITQADLLLLMQGHFVLFKNRNRWFEAPVRLLGGGGGFSGVGAGVTLLQNGSFSTNDYYQLRRPDGKLLKIPIQAEDPMHCAIEWRPAAVFVAPIEVTIDLHGQFVGMVDRV